MTFPASIQSRVTLLVFGFGLALIGFTAWRNDAWLVERRWQRVMEAADDQAALLAGTMQHFARNSLGRAAELQMNYAATAGDMKSGAVINESDLITVATRLDWAGLPLADSPMARDADLVRQVRESMSGAVERLTDELSVRAAYPFLLNYDSTTRGVVLLRYDLHRTLARSRWEALHQSVTHACVLCVLCVCLWLMLDATVTGKVRRILAYAEAVRTDGPLPGVLKGEDELAQISTSFDQTVQTLRATERNLLEASERERRRIGADIHDDVCQRIAGAQLKSGVLASALEKERHAKADLARTTAEELGLAARVARGFARGLAPMLVERGRLLATLEDMAGTVADAFGVQCECTGDLGGKTFGLWVDTHVYRIMQELSVNAAKHARPRRVHGEVRVHDARLEITIENDGRAFEIGDHPGLGLETVRQRVRALGGRLEISVRPDGSGCLARCRVELQPRHFVDHEADGA